MTAELRDLLFPGAPPRSPGAALRRPVGLCPGGPAADGGVAFVSWPPSSFGRQAIVPPPLVGRGGRGGRTAGAGGGGSGQWLAASGQRGPAAPYGAGGGGRVLGWGACPDGGVSRGTGPSPSLCAPRLGWRAAAVTCVAACGGARPAAAVGSADGSAGGWGRCAEPGGASCWPSHP